MCVDAEIDLLSVRTSDEVRDQLEFLQSKLDCCLVIDGESLQVSHGPVMFDLR